MSYRSFKRVLGESNLERKCLFLFGTSLLLLIFGSFLWYGERTNEIVYQQNPKTGRMLVNNIMLHHWKYLETNNDFKPIVDELIKDFKKEDYDWSVIRPAINNPDADKKPKDAFERALLELWVTAPKNSDQQLYADREQVVERKGEADDSESREIAEYHYYQPVFHPTMVSHATSVCVRCHQMENPNIMLMDGDLLAIIHVQIPLEESYAAINWNRALLWAPAIITVFLAMMMLYSSVRAVRVKPFQHLRD
ncbi:MAG: hypothetical protein N2C12_05430, partial [Planctomycetales bacterium]